MSSSPDHLYLDLSIVNNDTTGEKQIPLNFRETRTNPILDNPSNYFMSVARFSVDTAGYTLPIFMPKLLLDGTNKDVNTTAYSVSIAKVKADATGITNLKQEYINWSPQDKTTLPPIEFFGNEGTIDEGIDLTLAQTNTTAHPNTTTTYDFSIAQNPLNSLPTKPQGWSIPASSSPLSISTTFTFRETDWQVSDYSYTYANDMDKPIVWETDAGVQSFRIGGGKTMTQIDGILRPAFFTEPSFLKDNSSSKSLTDLNAYYAGLTFSAFDGTTTYNNIKIKPYNPNTPETTGVVKQPSSNASYAYTEGFYQFFVVGTPFGAGTEGSIQRIVLTNTNLQQGKNPIQTLTETHNSDTSTTITFKDNITDKGELGLSAPDYDQLFRYVDVPAYLSPNTDNNWAIQSIVFNPTTLVLNAQDYSTGYYACFTPDWWISLVNKTIASVFNISVTAETGISTAQAPVLTLDPITNNITLLTPSATWVDANDSNKTKYVNFAIRESLASGDILEIGDGEDKYVIFFNESLYSLFSSFNSARFGRKSTTTFFDAPSTAVINRNPEGVGILAYQIIPLNKNESNLSTLNGKNWYFNPTMYSPVPMWSPIQSIVFSTSLLPIQVSMTNPPQVYGSSIYDQTFKEEGGNNSQISTMISDVAVPLTSGNEYKPSITYAPSGEYRMIDLLGNSPVSQVGFAVAFKTKLGDIIPLRLGVGCGASVKLLFRRKRFNLGNVEPYDTN